MVPHLERHEQTGRLQLTYSLLQRYRIDIKFFGKLMNRPSRPSAQRMQEVPRVRCHAARYYCSPLAIRPCARQKNRASFRFSSIRLRDKPSCPMPSFLLPSSARSKRISCWCPVPSAGTPFTFALFIRKQSIRSSLVDPACLIPRASRRHGGPNPIYLLTQPCHYIRA